MFAAIANLTLGLRSNGSARQKDIDDIYCTESIENADEILLETLSILSEFTGKKIGYVDMCDDHVFQFDATAAADKEKFVEFSSKVKVDYQLVFDFNSQRCYILFAVKKDQTDHCCVSGIDSNTHRNCKRSTLTSRSLYC